VATTDDRSTEHGERRNGSGPAAGGPVVGVTHSAPSATRRARPLRADRWWVRPFEERAVRPDRFKEGFSRLVGHRFRRMSLMWAGARHKWRPGVWATVLVTAALGAILLGAIATFFGATLPVHPQMNCARHDFGCGVLGGALVTVVTALAAVTWLILVRVFQIVNWGYARQARKKPSTCVPTAANVAEVVGRDDVCRVIANELRDVKTRRPQVIVGGVGAGKTAVLVRLTQWLAERGAVPVAVRLRDLTDDGIRDLAARRFRSVNEHRFRSDGEADRIWRRLCLNGVVVILADGLEEAMLGTDARETSIRQVLEDARGLGLPLVITSRPDDALITLDAALVELGPLDEEQALEYVRDSRQREDSLVIEEQTLRALMSAAKVAEMPLYLQLTRDLYAQDLLRPADLTNLDDEHRLDIRLRLLENWRLHIEEGRLQRDPSITTKQRAAAIEVLSAVAARTLVMDRLEVKFKSLKPDEEHPPLVDIDPAKARVASNLGARLGIVETLDAGVRFRHSIMQAYLGSIWIREHAMEDEDYLAAGLEKGGREFLMALTMASIRFSDEPGGGALRSRVLRNVTTRLSDAAASGPEGDGSYEDRRVLLLAAAYEIERMFDDQPTSSLGMRCRQAWPPDSDSSRLVAAKRLAVDRIAEARTGDAYQVLYDLCITEKDYRVRVAAAQHLGSGGDVASRALEAALEKVVTDARAMKRENGFGHMTHDDVRRFSVQGWILPLMAATAQEEGGKVIDLLDRWVHVCDGAPASLDACVAQGFKYEANRVLRPRADRTARELLVQQAEALLDKTDYWYTRLTLLHAMTLWMLSESPRPRADQRQRLMRWCGEHSHPFVSAAAELCARALATRNPSPYIWIDETGIVAKLGQQTATVEANGGGSLWLTDSLGWVALRPRAVRLVADAMLMLNLTDGLQSDNGAAVQHERIRRASKPTLPPCVMRAGQRSYLSVLGGEHDRWWALPGVTCAGSCEFRLCPYPLTGETLRPEFSESFCRHVASVRARSHWHDTRKGEHKNFWRDMERRARAG
jgi:hypothetical protein